MAKLRRGFKAFSEEVALEVRLEMGLEPDSPLDPLALADHFLIPVAPFSGLVGLGLAKEKMGVLVRRGSPISAFTAFIGYRKLIYYNDGHSAQRNANSISHELAHILLEHEPALAAVPAAGETGWDAAQEKEADWLAGALLVPRCAALRWLENGGGTDDGAVHFGVSRELFNWRVNNTGVRTQLSRRARYR